jgi:hypothetical protein
MSRSRSRPSPRWQTTIYPPGRIDWSDDKLARLNAGHLKLLLENLGTQRAIGRLSAKESLDLARRIIARLPPSAERRRLLSRALMQLDAQAAADFHLFAAELRWRFDPSDAPAPRRSTDNLSRRPPPSKAAPHRLFAMDGSLASGLRITDVRSVAGDRAWSLDGRGRVLVEQARRYAEAQRTYEALIARLASKRAPRD